MCRGRRARILLHLHILLTGQMCVFVYYLHTIIGN
jgi:hypothetical protein